MVAIMAATRDELDVDVVDDEVHVDVVEMEDDAGFEEEVCVAINEVELVSFQKYTLILYLLFLYPPHSHHRMGLWTLCLVPSSECFLECRLSDQLEGGWCNIACGLEQ